MPSDIIPILECTEDTDHDPVVATRQRREVSSPPTLQKLMNHEAKPQPTSQNRLLHGHQPLSSNMQHQNLMARNFTSSPETKHSILKSNDAKRLEAEMKNKVCLNVNGGVRFDDERWIHKSHRGDRGICAECICKVTKTLTLNRQYIVTK